MANTQQWQKREFDEIWDSMEPFINEGGIKHDADRKSNQHSL